MPRTSLAHPLKVVFEFESDPEGGSGWLVRIPEIRGCHTSGRSIAEARRNIREALAVSLDDDDREAIAAAAVFEEDIHLPAAVRRAYARATAARARAAQAHAAEAAAAREITETLSLRDAGELLGISQEGVRRLKAS